MLLHAGFGALPLAYWLAGAPRGWMLGVAGVLALPYVALDALRLVWPRWNRWVFTAFAPFLRSGEVGRLTGASYSLIALVIGVWAFSPPVVAAAFLYHSVSDPAAGWVGRRWGQHRIGEKSLEGLAAFVLAGCAVSWPLVGALPGLLGATLAGLAELALPLDDNLSVPLAGGGSLALWAVAAS